ncbi:MAG: hypothetical protein M1837_006303 [Sclerophora amabilis]|nr:MAG: hypothetical protein M1837_006303 [Sclerophora amabilis]
MEWLATKVNQLRHLTTNEIDSSRYDGRSKQRRRWTLFGPAKPHEEETKIYLPMNQETLVAFDGVITSYQNLALTVLLTLNMEIRCQAIYSLTNSVRSNYLFADPVNDPDPGILTLNADLVTFDEDITTYLRDQEHNFLTVGLSHLLDALLLSLATSTMNTTSPTPQPHGSPTHATANPANKPRIASMNNHGADRMQLNILVLQQNLKNIEHEPPSVSLNRSARFFDLFLEGPDAILAKVKEGGGPSHGNEDDGTIFDFSYDELKALVELCYSEPLASERRDVAMQAKRQLNDRLLVLSEHLWQS